MVLSGYTCDRCGKSYLCAQTCSEHGPVQNKGPIVLNRPINYHYGNYKTEKQSDSNTCIQLYEIYNHSAYNERDSCFIHNENGYDINKIYLHNSKCQECKDMYMKSTNLACKDGYIDKYTETEALNAKTEALDSLVPFYIETVLGKTKHMTILEKTRDNAQEDCKKQPNQSECYKTANLNYDISKKNWENTDHIYMLKNKYLVDAKTHNGNRVQLRELRSKYDTRINDNHENDGTCSDCNVQQQYRTSPTIDELQLVINEWNEHSKRREFTETELKAVQEETFKRKTDFKKK